MLSTNSAKNSFSKEVIKLKHNVPEDLEGIEWAINPQSSYFKEIIEEIVTKEGWDNSHYCYDIWRRSFESDFKLYCAFDKKARRLIATVSRAWHKNFDSNGQGVLHCSMYYVRDEYRGLKLGLQLCEQAFSDAPSMNLFCYGVANMYKKYKSLMKFEKFADWRLQTTYALCSDIRLETLGPIDTSIELKHWRLVPIEDILSYDKKLTCGINRQAYLSITLQHPDSLTMVATTKEGQMVGVCQIRELLANRLGMSMFYADNDAVAKTLMKYVLEEFPKSRYRTLDSYAKFVYKTPSTNVKSCEMFTTLVDGHILEKQVLMPQFTKELLHFPTHLIYSICDEHSGLI